MKSQVNPVVAIVVIVVVVLAVLGVLAMKTGNNTGKRLETGLDSSQMEKDPAGARKALADDVQKYQEKKSGK